MPGMPAMPDMPDMQHFEFSFGMPWGDLELVGLNPDLGEYFGTKEGELVVKAPADSSLPVKGGDVILSISGRKPSSPSHAMRILRSYEAGETVSIELMRKQKRLTVAWKVPEPEARHMRRSRGHEEQSHFRPGGLGVRKPFGPHLVQERGRGRVAVCAGARVAARKPE